MLGPTAWGMGPMQATLNGSILAIIGPEKTVRTWCHHLPLSLAVEAPLSLIPAALLMILLSHAYSSQMGALEGYALACTVGYSTIVQLSRSPLPEGNFQLRDAWRSVVLINKEAPSGTDGR